MPESPKARVIAVECNACANQPEYLTCSTCGLTGKGLVLIRHALPSSFGFLRKEFSEWTGYGASFQTDMDGNVVLVP